MDIFNTRIHTWYSLFKRDLPWRNTCNPYSVWLSEIILQQTRIDQGLAYYLKFMDEFPTISDLANASEDQILKLWQGLGYYSRARNLHSTSKIILKKHNGIFPSDYNSILSLKGIGEYTAAAIASISFNLEYPAVDGNVYRVLSRFFGISEPIDTGRGKKIFRELAAELIKGVDPGMHNQALMEFGALQCVPRNPDCSQCPLNDYCFAWAAGKINELPFKQNKIKQRDRFFNYLVFDHDAGTYLRKRTDNDIWRNLFEFPFIEMQEETSIENLLMQEELQSCLFSDQFVVGPVSTWKIHLLSHQRIHYRFIRIYISGKINLPDDLIRVNKQDIFNFAVPKLIESFLAEFSPNGMFI